MLKPFSSFPGDLIESVNVWCLVGSADSQRDRHKSPVPDGERNKNCCTHSWKSLMCFLSGGQLHNPSRSVAKQNPDFSFSCLQTPQYLSCPFQLILIQMEANRWRLEWKLRSGEQLPFPLLPKHCSVLLSHLLLCRSQCSSEHHRQ